MSDNNLELRCGGTLELVYYEHAECVTVPFQGFSNIQDPSRLSCKLTPNDPEETDSGAFYQEALGVVIFNCFGASSAERTATVALPTMTIANCSAPVQSNNADRQRLLGEDQKSSQPLSLSHRIHQPPKSLSSWSLSVQKARERALEAVQVKGGAVSFISMGRYCQEPSGDWLLWHERYSCEEGDRMVITPAGELYDPGNDPLGSQSSGGSGSGSSGGIFDEFLGQFLKNGGGRKLLNDPSAEGVKGKGRYLQFDDIMGPIYKYANLYNFCYAVQNTSACTDSAGVDSAGCTFELSSVRMSDADSRSTCASRENDGPPLGLMQKLAEQEFDPQKFIDLISKNL